MTSYNMVLQSQLELMMKIAKKRPEIGKPENDLGQKMVQVCIKENDPGFQNIEIDRKMV